MYGTVCVGLFTIAPRPVAGHGSPTVYSAVGEMCSFIFMTVSSVVVVAFVVVYSDLYCCQRKYKNKKKHVNWIREIGLLLYIPLCIG